MENRQEFLQRALRLNVYALSTLLMRNVCSTDAAMRAGLIV